MKARLSADRCEHVGVVGHVPVIDGSLHHFNIPIALGFGESGRWHTCRPYALSVRYCDSVPGAQIEFVLGCRLAHTPHTAVEVARMMIIAQVKMFTPLRISASGWARLNGLDPQPSELDPPRLPVTGHSAKDPRTSDRR